jgi:hypothetical protein
MCCDTFDTRSAVTPIWRIRETTRICSEPATATIAWSLVYLFPEYLDPGYLLARRIIPLRLTRDYTLGTAVLENG